MSTTLKLKVALVPAIVLALICVFAGPMYAQTPDCSTEPMEQIKDWTPGTLANQSVISATIGMIPGEFQGPVTGCLQIPGDFYPEDGTLWPLHNDALPLVHVPKDSRVPIELGNDVYGLGGYDDSPPSVEWARINIPMTATVNMPVQAIVEFGPEGSQFTMDHYVVRDPNSSVDVASSAVGLTITITPTLVGPYTIEVDGFDNQTHKDIQIETVTFEVVEAHPGGPEVVSLSLHFPATTTVGVGITGQIEVQPVDANFSVTEVLINRMGTVLNYTDDHVEIRPDEDGHYTVTVHGKDTETDRVLSVSSTFEAVEQVVANPAVEDIVFHCPYWIGEGSTFTCQIEVIPHNANFSVNEVTLDSEGMANVSDVSDGAFTIELEPEFRGCIEVTVTGVDTKDDSNKSFETSICVDALYLPIITR